MFMDFGKINPDTITSIAIGVFDGIHMGHQQLIKELDQNGAILAINSSHMDLTPGKMREKFTTKPFVYVNLGEICNMSGQEFIQNIIFVLKNIKKIVVGYDFKFGKDRTSCAKDLKNFFNGEVVMVKQHKINGIPVHSKTIRNFLRMGNVSRASILLGRFYSIESEIIKGQGIGMRKLFPTLNLRVNGMLLPSEGVFASYTMIKNQKFPSVSFIGHRVSTDGSYAIETHILNKIDDFNSDKAVIEFVKKIRDNRYYDNLEELKVQIAQDIEQANLVLEKYEKNC